MKSASHNRLIVFLKAPRPGFVKTRLAEVIGPAAANTAYRNLVDEVVRRIEGIKEVEMRFSPDDALEEIRPWSRPGWQLTWQGDGDLGERLVRAFNEQFSSGAERIVVIGSDCPEVLESDVVEAWDALAGCDVVLGPAMDGGYWLIGLRSSQPELFNGIPWSSPVVLEQTLNRAHRLGLSFHLLRRLSDVDTVEDLQAWRDRQAKPAQSSIHLDGETK